MIRLVLAVLLLVAAPVAAARIAVDGVEAVVVGALVALMILAGIVAAGAELERNSADGSSSISHP